jgi:hypothetical protein
VTQYKTNGFCVVESARLRRTNVFALRVPIGPTSDSKPKLFAGGCVHAYRGKGKLLNAFGDAHRMQFAVAQTRGGCIARLLEKILPRRSGVFF